ncbi:MAG: hypothetical protein OXN93_11030 [bacterium]|nr:hypothetical protein [bacterium]
MNSTVETETSWKVGALTVSDSGAWVVVVVVAAGRVVVAVIGPGAVVVVVVSGRVVVGAVVAVGAVVVVVVVAGRVVVVAVSGGDVEMVVVLVVAGTAVVVVARVLSGAAVEVGLEDGGGEGGSGGVIVVAEVIEVLEAGGSARVCVFSDPVRHAPRSNGTIAAQAVGFLGICPERRAVREQCCRAIREGSPGSLGWMELAAVRVKWAPGKWTTLWPAGDPGSRHTLILAHGAGAGASHPLVAGLRDQLVAAGAFCVTFNYPYTEEGRRRPDRIDRLLACHRAVADWVRGEVCETPVFGGPLHGRSYGYLPGCRRRPGPGLGALRLSPPSAPPTRPAPLRAPEPHIGSHAVLQG